VFYLLKSITATGSKQETNFPFYAPPASTADPFINHTALTEVSANKSFTISAIIAGVNTSNNVSVELRTTANKWRTLEMQQISAHKYSITVPPDMVTPGILNYRIFVKRNGETFTFPGGYKGNPYEWDYYQNESWQTKIVSPSAPLILFDPEWDRSNIMVYNPDWRNNTIEYITDDEGKVEYENK
jgi:hypothetical protein